ncbi:MAG TPA: phosphate acyltransferase PlsX [Gammaproteobacteria bacterium]|nr:phosphate acyltransferase PlsX [Gammaproteobacteria bacterium]
MSKICIAIDAMGGDQGPNVTVPAALKALAEFPELHLILVGNQVTLVRALEATKTTWDKSRLHIHHATQVVEMDESPALALRGKRDSSMRVALNLVQDGTAKACVSAGNTGALMATARYVLKMLPAIDRPAILFPIPSQVGVVYMLDLGANVDCTAEHLFQFAVMGSILVASISNDVAPKVGLLNIGSEAIKGNEAVKQAAQLLEQKEDINYIGYVEGDDIYKGVADVVVCDGFVGNVALKASEGVAKLILQIAREEFGRSWLSRLTALLCIPVLKRVYARTDLNKYNGASLLGLRGVVIKSHGGANTEAFTTAIRKAIKEAEMNVPEKIHAAVAAKLAETTVE